MKTENEQKELLIRFFKENQTLTNLGILKNNGIKLFVLTHNKWEPLEHYKLPFNKFIPIYDDNFKINGIGIYK